MPSINMATSTSYSRTLQENHQHQLAMRDKLSFLAQAKPAIISQEPSSIDDTGSTGADGLFSSHEDNIAISLSDKISATLRFHSSDSAAGREPANNNSNSNYRNSSSSSSMSSSSSSSSSHLIEDDSLIDKQNAANQMRQAAVMAAVASQQSKRLSATERLALTAKRPSTIAPPPSQPQQQQQQQQQQQPQATLSDMNKRAQLPPPPPLPLHQNQNPNPAPNSNLKHQSQSKPPTRPTPQPKPQLQKLQVQQSAQAVQNQLKASTSGPATASLPTLETLLAVQRQLQRHTRQNLTPTIEASPLDQNLAHNKTSDGAKDKLVEAASRQAQEAKGGGNADDKHYPNLAKFCQFKQEQNAYVTASIRQQQQQVLPVETYDKELPPLPAGGSVSPSTNSYTTSGSSATGLSSDESQLNSLESQSSPATSLVSLPPPPPPISSYLQQYDQATSAAAAAAATGTQLTSSHLSPASGQRQSSFPLVPIKQQHQNPNQNQNQLSQQSQICNSNSTGSSAADGASSQWAQVSGPQVPSRPPVLAPRPQHLTQAAANSQTATTFSQGNKFVAPPPPPPMLSAQHHHRADQQLNNGYTTNSTATTCSNTQLQASHSQHQKQQLASNHSNNKNATKVDETDRAASSQPLPAVSSAAGSYSSPALLAAYSCDFMPPPPEPLSDSPQCSAEASAGFDEPDCAPVRFPTPPANLLLRDDGNDDDDDDDLYELKKKLLKEEEASNGSSGSSRGVDSLDDDDEDDDDDSFQCRIPTPPPSSKSVSFASFQDLTCRASSQFVSGDQYEQQAKSLLAQQQHHFNFKPPTTNQGHHQAHQLRRSVHFSSSSFSAQTLATPSAPQSGSTSASVATNFNVQPPPLFRQAHQPQPHHQQQTSAASSSAGTGKAPQLTVRINSDDEMPPPPAPVPVTSAGLLSTAATADQRPIHSQQHNHALISESAANQLISQQQHSIMMAMAQTVAQPQLLASSSSPSSSSDGDGRSSNSSSSTSGVHSSIDSPLSSSSLSSHLKLDPAGDKFSYDGPSKLSLLHQNSKTLLASRKLAASNPAGGQHVKSASFAVASQPITSRPQTNLKDYLIQTQQRQQQHQQQQQQQQQRVMRMMMEEKLQQQQQHQQQQVIRANSAGTMLSARRNSNSSLNSIASTATSGNGSVTSSASVSNKQPVQQQVKKLPARPALKQKKTVSFSDKIEMVACAEDQCDNSRLPNPLLARVLAAKLAQ